MTETEQMEFPSLAFPKDRKILRVEEVAFKLDVTAQHIHDLMEEGAIKWIDLSGKNNSSDRKTRRIPVEAYEQFLRESTR